MPGRGPAAAAEQDATGGYRFQALAKEPGVRPFQERNGMGGAHEEGKAQGFCIPLCAAASGAELSPGAHSVDEWTGQSEGTSGQEADRRQDAAFCPSLLAPVRHPAPFREVAHDSLILSSQLQPLWSFVHCPRTAWAYLPPVPEGTAHESGKIACQKPPNHPDDRIPGTDERGGAFFQSRGAGTRTCTACGIPLAGHA